MYVGTDIYAIDSAKLWLSIMLLAFPKRLTRIYSGRTSIISFLPSTEKISYSLVVYLILEYLSSSESRWMLLLKPRSLCGARMVLLKLLLSLVRLKYFDECWLSNQSFCGRVAHQRRGFPKIGLVCEDLKVFSVEDTKLKGP